MNILNPFLFVAFRSPDVTSLGAPFFGIKRKNIFRDLKHKNTYLEKNGLISGLKIIIWIDEIETVGTNNLERAETYTTPCPIVYGRPFRQLAKGVFARFVLACLIDKPWLKVLLVDLVRERKILFVGWKSTAYKPNKSKRTGRMISLRRLQTSFIYTK